MCGWIVRLCLLALFVTVAAAAQAEVIEFGIDRPGGDYNSFGLGKPDPTACKNACEGEPMCQAWTFIKPGVQGPNARCVLKNVVTRPVTDACCVSGTIAGAAAPGDGDVGAVPDDAGGGVQQQGGGFPLPAGSWQQTCRNGRLIGTLMEAECLGHNGDYNTADIDLRRCPNGPISNNNGRLTCGEPGAAKTAGTNPPDVLPAGSWQQECSVIDFSPGELLAECPDADGVPTTQMFDPSSCSGTVSNIDGYLTCD